MWAKLSAQLAIFLVPVALAFEEKYRGLRTLFQLSLGLDG